MTTTKVALVTGGGTGIGFACAQSLAEDGVTVVIAGRRATILEDAISRIVATVPTARVAAIPADLGLPTGPKALIDAVLARHGRLDVLVNAAGTCSPVPTGDMDAVTWDGIVNVALRGAALCSVEAARHMPTGGRIVMITSIDEAQSEPNVAHYCAAKAGLGAFARSFAVDLSGRGISVNSVAPGWVHTDAASVRLDRATEDSMARLNPLARAGRPDEIASVVRYLATEAPAYLTGSTITVDGGQTIMAAMP